MVEEFRGSMLPEPPWHRAQGSEIDRQIVVLDGIIGESRGLLGELSVVFQVKGILNVRTRVREIVPQWDTLTSKRHLGEIDIDLVFKSGNAWGLVKNWKVPADMTKIKAKRVVRRLRELQEDI